MTFKDRLDLVLADRKISPWAKALGFSNGTIGRLNDGEIPGQEILAQIARVENVSLDWLVNGRGHPYWVNNTTSDAETAESLTALGAESWRIDIISSPRQAAIMLSQPAEWTFKATRVPYIAIELVCGPIGEQSLAWLRAQMESGNDLHHTAVSSELMADIYAGKLGTHQLIAAPDGLLRNAQTVSRAALAGLLSPAWASALDALSADEQAFLELYRRISSTEKAHAIAVVGALGKLPAPDKG